MKVTISPVEAYEKMRSLARTEQPEHLRKQGFIPPNQRIAFASPKSSDRRSYTKPIYKAWVKD